MHDKREKVKNWLEEIGVKNYVINEDLTVDVNSSVEIFCEKLKEIPIQFGVINGDFHCNNNDLTNLKGCPKVINGKFDCSFNNITSLEHSPQIVKGSFCCDYNKLTNLKFFPQEIHSDFSCVVNELTSLEGIPREVNGDFNCSNNHLTSLEGCPTEVKGDFSCSRNKLTSLKNCPEIIKGDFSCNKNKLIDLEYFPVIVEGLKLNIINNEIKEEELSNFNCDIKNVKEIYSDFNENGNKEEFFDKVNYYKSKKENKLLQGISDRSNNVKLNKKL